MNILSVLTLIFVTLKLTDIIDWPWGYVLLPTIIHMTLFVGILVIAAIMVAVKHKKYR